MPLNCNFFHIFRDKFIKMWYEQNVWNLQEDLNAAAEKLAINVYNPSLDERFKNMSMGTVIGNKSCPHSAKKFNVFSPPQGTICVWSCLMSLASGAQDPRWIEGFFDESAFLCHSPGTQNMNAAMNMCMAFSDITNVSSFTKKMQYINSIYF